MWRSIRDLSRQGTAVLVTTHFLEEAEHCNNLGCMVAGVIVAEGSPSAIKSSQPGQLFEVRYDNLQSAYGLLKKIVAPWRVSMFADSLHIVLDHPQKDWPQIEAALAAHSQDVAQLSRRSLGFSLEDAFISIVQRASGATAE
jgi:ABC-2 type transport system ATP-binding protein